MAWFSNKDNDTTATEMERAAQAAPPATTEQLSSYSPGQKILMQDTKPRFDPDQGGAAGSNSAPPSREMMRSAFSNLSLSDFSFAKMSEVPCFRDAGLVGFSAMFIMGSVTLLYHKNPLKAANWATGGLLLGSVVGWEQCRMKRKRSMEMSQAAMQAMQKRDKSKAAPDAPRAKSRKEISPEKQKEIDILKREWEIHTNDAAAMQQKKPWYKLW